MIASESEIQKHRSEISARLVGPVASACSFVEPAIGCEKPEYRFSQSTGMGFGVAQRLYKERFGSDVAWLEFFHPIQRRAVYSYACEQNFDLRLLTRRFKTLDEQVSAGDLWVTLYSTPDMSHIGGLGQRVPEHHKISVVEYLLDSELTKDHYYLIRHKVGCFWMLQKFSEHFVDGAWRDISYPSVFEGSSDHYVNCAYGPYWRVSPALAGKSIILDHWAENPDQGPKQRGFKVVEWGLLEKADLRLMR